MRKKVYGFLIGLIGLFISYGVAYACPMQYTIEGLVIQGPGIDDSAGYLSQLGITIGSSVSYTLSIDIDAAASKVLSDGSTIPLLTSETYNQLNYYAHLVAGTTLTTDIWQNSHEGIAEYNLIANSGYPNDLYMLAATGNNSLQFVGLNFDPNSWVVGSRFSVYSMRNYIYDEYGNCSSFSFDGRITNVVTAPVPEPSTFLLLSVALIGAGFYRKKNCRRV